MLVFLIVLLTSLLQFTCIKVPFFVRADHVSLDAMGAYRLSSANHGGPCLHPVGGDKVAFGMACKTPFLAGRIAV